MSLHILDIALNSVEAGADEIIIRIREDSAGDFLSFTVADNGPGIDKDLLPLITDPFYTTKEKNKKVGLGLSLLKAAAERCDGGFMIDASPGKGVAVTALFRHSHIDRAPLGDLSGTITVLLNGPGLKSLVYEHEVDDRKFVFNLKELLEGLGRVPPDNPAVLYLVRNYLEEGIKGLYGGAKDEVPRGTRKPAQENAG